MKILFIRNAGRFSGSETYNLNLFKELGHYSDLEIHFLTNLPAFARRARGYHIKSKVISWGREGIGTKKQLLRAIFSLPIILPCYLVIIHSLEKDNRFTAICLQSMTEKILLTPILKIRGYKVIWTELGPIYATQMSKFITYLYKKVSVFADKIITISQDTRADLIRGGVSPAKITTVHIGIDTSEFIPSSNRSTMFVKKTLGIPNNSIIIGYLGTVTYEKGIVDFVQVSEKLHKASNKYHFIIIGDGPNLDQTKRAINNTEIAKFYRFTGFVKDVRKYLSTFDILFLPTRHYEGTSLAILEAQSMGKIVITSSMGGNLEVITDSIDGFIYKIFNISEIVNLIESLVASKHERLAIGIKARENITSRFNIKKQAKEFDNIIEHL